MVYFRVTIVSPAVVSRDLPGMDEASSGFKENVLRQAHPHVLSR